MLFVELEINEQENIKVFCRERQEKMEIMQWIISGVCGAGILLLTAIWAEVRKTSDKVQEISILVATQNSRIDSIEKILDKLPCLNNINCPKNDT